MIRSEYIMDRESLKRHCEATCHKFKDVPTSGIYSEHRFILDLLKQTTWIPVNERLPEDGTWNIFTDGNKISIERYKFDAMDHFWPSGRWFDFEDAIAWMPLPKRYEGGN